MSKAKHTPAPWSANEATITYTQFDITAKDSFIGEVGGGRQSDDEIEANARLIAEAPSMYEALKEILDDLRYDRSCISIKEIEELIKKIEE